MMMLGPSLVRRWSPLRRAVVADGWIVRSMGQDLANLLGPDLIVCRPQRFPQDLLADRKVPPLLSGEVFRYQGTAGASEVRQRASQIHADVDLAVRVGDLVDRLRSVHESAGYAHPWAHVNDIARAIPGQLRAALGD